MTGNGVREFRRPMELAGLKGRLERARGLEVRIGDAGRRYDKVLDAIEVKVGLAEAHAGHLEHYDSELAEMVSRMVGEGSNNPPGESDGGSRDGQ
jgi:hypothetical protein